MATDYVGVLEKVAGIGYKEIEPSGGYGNLSPKEFRALLDRLGLSMPSTHSGASGVGLELEKQLEGSRQSASSTRRSPVAGAAAPPGARAVSDGGHPRSRLPLAIRWDRPKT